jgi:hypothetical protein
VDIVQFAVGEQAGPSDAGQDIARFAVDTFLSFTDRAFAFSRSLALFDQQYPAVRIFAKIVCCKEACGASADNNDVILLRVVGVFAHGCISPHIMPERKILFRPNPNTRLPTPERAFTLCAGISGNGGQVEIRSSPIAGQAKQIRISNSPMFKTKAVIFEPF